MTNAQSGEGLPGVLRGKSPSTKLGFWGKAQMAQSDDGEKDSKMWVQSNENPSTKIDE